VASPQKNIRAVFFDVGGVLTTAVSTAIPEAARHSGVDLAAIGPTMREMFTADDTPNNPSHRLERGEITFDEFLAVTGDIGEEIRKLLHHEAPNSMFRFMTRHDGMNAFVDEVRSTGRHVGLISNVVAEWLPIWATYTDPIERFDTVVFSCASGLRKPGEGIFLRALEMSGMQPDEVLYLDDGQHMVDVARRMGMHAIVVNEHASAIAEARTYL
jgi:putative hydrolase of the HAD superfamily